jgi:Type II CAAX prenyl endopeptidase Rce1-like
VLHVGLCQAVTQRATSQQVEPKVNVLVVALLLVQDTGVGPVRPPRAGSDFWLPFASLFVPGTGQYATGSPLVGARFTTAAVAGYALYFTGDAAGAQLTDLPRMPAGQRALVGLELANVSGFLSAYDAFHRALPNLQREGKYTFMTAHESPGRVLLAPFDPHLLRRWTTWIDLAHTGIVTTIFVLSETKAGKRYAPFRLHDGAFATSLAFGAGTGEEAAFRGWLYPLLYQNLGRRAWLANGIQATIFGGLHVPQAGVFAADIAAWGFYEGWLTRRNGWSVRESVFHHFWYDAVVIAATLLTQGARSVTISLRCGSF